MRQVMRSRTARWLIAVVAGVALGCGAKVKPGLNVAGTKLEVKFDRPMVATDVIGRDVPSGPLRIRPALAGKLRWLDARTLAFVPAAPLPGATRFEVAGPGGAVALDGLGAVKDVRWSFETERLRARFGGDGAALPDSGPRPTRRSRSASTSRCARGTSNGTARTCGKPAAGGGRRQHGRDRRVAPAVSGDPARPAGAGHRLAVSLRSGADRRRGAAGPRGRR